MKKAQILKKELLIILVCLVFAFGLNIISVLKDGADWGKIFEQLHIVILVTVLMYILILMFRLFAWGIIRLFKNK